MRKEKLERKRVKKEFDKNRDCGMWNDGRGRDSGRRQMRDVGAWSYASLLTRLTGQAQLLQCSRN